MGASNANADHNNRPRLGAIENPSSIVEENAGTVTQEFHISVTPVGSNEYLVRTERVAPGVPLAEEQMCWDVEAWMTQAHQLMNDPLLGLLQGYGSHRVGGFELPTSGHDLGDPSPPLSFVKLGQHLYNALFQGTLRDSWVTAQGIAHNRSEVLRLRLGLKGTQLPRLPWEVLHGGDMTGERPRASQSLRPLATGTDVIFSRYQPGINLAGGLQASLESDQPLRILMAIAAPTDQEQLDLKREATHLQRELCHQNGSLSGVAAGGKPSSSIQVTILEQPGREQLTQALEQGQYQVFHFAGHSNLGTSGGCLYLVNHNTGLTETLSGDDLAGLLVNNNIRMAVFNSCRGAHAATANPTEMGDRSLAEALVSRGTPAVLAMAERIPDNVALTLTRLFYRNLKQGYPVDLSLSRARQGLISAYGSHQLYWALPILYLHPDFDGYLTSRDRAIANPADYLVRFPYIDTNDDGVEADFQAADFQAADFQSLATLDDLVIDQPETAPGSVEDAGADLSYDTDRSIVADLVEKLTQQKSEDEGIIPAAEDETLLPDSANTGLEIYSKLPENPLYGQPPTPATATSGQTTPAVLEPLRHLGQQIWQSVRRRQRLLPLSAVGIVAIALAGFWLSHRPIFQSSPTEITLPNLGSIDPSDSAGLGDIKDMGTPELVALATDRFKHGEIEDGRLAVEELLDRNTLPEAETALSAVPRDQLNDPMISFLRGRLAWQAFQVGTPDHYSPDDALRYWKTAIDGQPDQPQLHQALGFAYYEEGDSNKAIQAWWRSLVLLEAQAKEQVPPPDVAIGEISLPEKWLTSEDALTAYAGIALALMQTSNQLSSPQQEEMQSKAVKLYQQVIVNNPSAFQPDALSKNWLWTETAIRDWRTLSTLQP